MTCVMKNNTVCKRQRKPKWQSRIDNLEAFGTRHKQNKTKTKQKKKAKQKKAKKKEAKNKTKTKLKNSTEHKRKDSKGATRTPKKNRQYNGQMNKDKKCDLQSTTQKTKIRAIRTQ